MAEAVGVACNTPPPAAMAYLPETKEELRAIVEEAVSAAVSTAIPRAVRAAVRKDYLTKAELMELTGWSARQVEYKKAQRELAYVKRGRLVLFPTEGVHAYLDAGLVPTRGAPAARGA